MSVIASFVVGANGASTLGGASQPLSTAADRERFLQRHRSAAAFIIGKNSATTENYATSRVPIFVFSRSSAPLDLPHPLMQQITVDRNLKEITELIDLRIPGDIVVEAGARLLTALIAVGVVERLELSITPIEGDGDFLDVKELLTPFEITTEIERDGTRLLECRYQGDARNS